MGRIDKEEIGHRQQLIMQCVWDAGEMVTVQEIIDRLEVKCGKRFSRSAINTLVLMLVDRGFLEQGPKIRQAYTYHPLISREQFRIREMKRFRRLTFEGSSAIMVETLLKSDVTPDEMDAIRMMLDQKNG